MTEVFKDETLILSNFLRTLLAREIFVEKADCSGTYELDPELLEQALDQQETLWYTTLLLHKKLQKTVRCYPSVILDVPEDSASTWLASSLLTIAHAMSTELECPHWGGGESEGTDAAMLTTIFTGLGNQENSFIARQRGNNFKIVKILAVIDGSQGQSADVLKAAGIELDALFTAQELVDYLIHIKDPKRRAAAEEVEEEPKEVPPESDDTEDDEV